MDRPPVPVSKWGPKDFVTYQRIFLADRHLIVTEGAGLFRPWTERRKEYLLSDIRAITITPTISGLLVHVLMAVLFLCGLPCLADSDTVWLAFSWWGIVAILEIIHLTRGSTCAVTVHTAVSHEKLGGWNRMRAARKGLALVVPAIQNAQRELALRSATAPAAAPADPGAPPGGN